MTQGHLCAAAIFHIELSSLWQSNNHPWVWQLSPSCFGLLFQLLFDVIFRKVLHLKKQVLFSISLTKMISRTALTEI